MDTDTSPMDPGRPAAGRTGWAWHVGFVALAAVTGWLVLMTGAMEPGRRMVAAVLLACGLALGWWIARSIAQSSHRPGLARQLAETRAELAELSRQAGVLAERQRLAQEIHDTLAQGFSAVLRLLDASESGLDRGDDPQAVRAHLASARATARANLAEARAMVAALTPPPLRDGALPDAVTRLADRLLAPARVVPTVTVAGRARPLPAEHEIALLRAAQEAASNIRAHADARHARVTLDYQPRRVALRVTDDGRGYDPDAMTPGYGLRGMWERAAALGGMVILKSAPGTGTEVEVALPLPELAGEEPGERSRIAGADEPETAQR